MKATVLVIASLFISTCCAVLETNGNELLLRTHDITSARRARDTGDRHLEGNHLAPRRPARREVSRGRKPKNILKSKKYKTV